MIAAPKAVREAVAQLATSVIRLSDCLGERHKIPPSEHGELARRYVRAIQCIISGRSKLPDSAGGLLVGARSLVRALRRVFKQNRAIAVSMALVIERTLANANQHETLIADVLALGAIYITAAMSLDFRLSSRFWSVGLMLEPRQTVPRSVVQCATMNFMRALGWHIIPHLRADADTQ